MHIYENTTGTYFDVQRVRAVTEFIRCVMKNNFNRGRADAYGEKQQCTYGAPLIRSKLGKVS